MPRISIIAAAAALAAFAAGASAQENEEEARQGAPAYRLCAACHSLKPGVHLSGPSLAGLWDRKAGTIESYGRYTKALKESGIVWDEDSLNAWLAHPELLVPGTAMRFRGVKDDSTRTDLIAFLRRAMAPGGAEKVVKQGLLPESMAAGQMPPDLSSVEANRRITEIRHCRHAYYVTTADGGRFPFWETNVRLKIDTSARGPGGGAPVLIQSGMAGDRVSVVFSSLDHLRGELKEKCE